MPKYIDLLRSHHKASANDAENKQAPESDATSASDKPGEKKSSRRKTAAKKPPARKTRGAVKRRSSPVSDNPEVWLRQCARIIRSFFRAAARNKTVQTERLLEHLQPQLQALSKDHAHINTLEFRLSEQAAEIHQMDEEFGDMIEKSMNMMLLALKLEIQLNMDKEQVVPLVLAAMLHHTGLARIPAKVRQKTDALTLDERRQIQGSARQGAQFLRDCGIRDEQIIEAVEQSQERMDGSGPNGLSGRQIGFLARVIGLLSFFEALVHFRPYRQRMLPRDAIREIILHHKQAFDASILKALIDAVSLYPVGTYVQLNSGDIAQVIHVHPRLPLRPTIRMCMDRNRQPIAPREVDLRVQSTLQVEVCMYPEDLEKTA